MPRLRRVHEHLLVAAQCTALDLRQAGCEQQDARNPDRSVDPLPRTESPADPDRDSFVNLVEYALDTDPRSRSSRPTLRVETVGDDFIEVTFERLLYAIDIDITPQITGDLRTWNAAAGSQVSETTNGDGSATVVITLPVALGKQLARVKVSYRVP